MTTATIPLSDAKARLSGIIQEVVSGEKRYIIERRGVPVAKLVPDAGFEVEDVFVALASYADPAKLALEDGAMMRALGEKHASRR